VSSAQQPAGQAGQQPAAEAGPPPAAPAKQADQPSAAQAEQPPTTQAEQAGPPPAAQAGHPPAGRAGSSRVPARPRAAGPGGVQAKPDLYRSSVAPVVWWVWVAFALANLIDLAVQGRDHFAAEVAVILILVTGIAYVTAFRPRVLVDDMGITIRNPLRDHHVPWGCVQDVDVRDSLEVHCTPQDGEQKSKTVYAWAVHSSRRSRLKAEARARRSAKSSREPPAAYARLPAEAQAALTRTDSENITSALGERATRARAAGATGGRRTARWDLPAIAALVLPALLVLVVSLL
jgi:Bacterial PH domain